MKFVKSKNTIKKKGRAKKRAKRRALKRKIKREQILHQERTSSFKRENNLISREKKSNCMSFQFPSRIGGECYWQNYLNVLHWQQNYQTFIANCNYQPISMDKFNNLCSEKRTGPYDKRRNNRPQDCLISGKNEASQLKDADELNDKFEQLATTPNEYEDCCDEESEDKYVVTDEMMEFLEISAKHKLEREMQKKEMLNKEKRTGDSKLIERDNVEECQAPKEMDADVTRRREMNYLYGDSAAMIMGMETALQLSFNRKCDIYKPPFWPAVALKLRFTD